MPERRERDGSLKPVEAILLFVTGVAGLIAIGFFYWAIWVALTPATGFVPPLGFWVGLVIFGLAFAVFMLYGLAMGPSPWEAIGAKIDKLAENPYGHRSDADTAESDDRDE